jgi:hypothetical protein
MMKPSTCLREAERIENERASRLVKWLAGSSIHYSREQLLSGCVLYRMRFLVR